MCTCASSNTCMCTCASTRSTCSSKLFFFLRRSLLCLLLKLNFRRDVLLPSSPSPPLKSSPPSPTIAPPSLHFSPLSSSPTAGFDDSDSWSEDGCSFASLPARETFCRLLQTYLQSKQVHAECRMMPRFGNIESVCCANSLKSCMKYYDVNMENGCHNKLSKLYDLLAVKYLTNKVICEKLGERCFRYDYGNYHFSDQHSGILRDFSTYKKKQFSNIVLRLGTSNCERYHPVDKGYQCEHNFIRWDLKDKF